MCYCLLNVVLKKTQGISISPSDFHTWPCIISWQYLNSSMLLPQLWNRSKNEAERLDTIPSTWKCNKETIQAQMKNFKDTFSPNSTKSIKVGRNTRKLPKKISIIINVLSDWTVKLTVKPRTHHGFEQEWNGFLQPLGKAIRKNLRLQTRVHRSPFPKMKEIIGTGENSLFRDTELRITVMVSKRTTTPCCS